MHARQAAWSARVWLERSGLTKVDDGAEVVECALNGDEGGPLRSRCSGCGCTARRCGCGSRIDIHGSRAILICVVLRLVVRRGHGQLVQSDELRVAVDAADHDESIIDVLQFVRDGSDTEELELELDDGVTAGIGDKQQCVQTAVVVGQQESLAVDGAHSRAHPRTHRIVHRRLAGNGHIRDGLNKGTAKSRRRGGSTAAVSGLQKKGSPTQRAD